MLFLFSGWPCDGHSSYAFCGFNDAVEANPRLALLASRLIHMRTLGSEPKTLCDWPWFRWNCCVSSRSGQSSAPPTALVQRSSSPARHASTNNRPRSVSSTTHSEVCVPSHSRTGSEGNARQLRCGQPGERQQTVGRESNVSCLPSTRQFVKHEQQVGILTVRVVERKRYTLPYTDR